nr:hypothetical protein [Tanacetum cinerariifolium]
IPPSQNYVSGPEHSSSPDYIPGPEHPPSPVEIPYVPEPEYPEYLAPSEDEAPLEDQPLPTNASPIAASPDYVIDFDLEEDREDDHADYHADGGNGDDEPSNDDDDDDTDNEDPKEEPFEDEEDDKEEEEHLALADSFVVPIVDHVLPAGDTDALEVDEPTHAPGSPIIIPLSQTHLRAPLGYRAARIRIRALLSSTSHGTDILEADMPPRKRACHTTPAPRFEIKESFAAGAVRQPGPTESDLRRFRVEQADYVITTTWDEIVHTLMEIALTTLEGVNERVTELDTTDIRDTFCHIDCPDFVTTDSVDYSIGCIKILEARDPKPKEGPAEAGSSWLSCMVINFVMSKNGDNNNDSGTDGRKKMTTPRERTYTDFLKCQPKSFQGTEGVVGLTRWKCHDMSKLSYEGYWIGCCLSNAMGSLEKDDHIMFPEEAAKVERYIGGLPNMIHGSVNASKPQSMQEAIEFATEMIDKKMLTHAERQTEKKRKLDDTSRNNQHQH